MSKVDGSYVWLDHTPIHLDVYGLRNLLWQQVLVGPVLGHLVADDVLPVGNPLLISFLHRLLSRGQQLLEVHQRRLNLWVDEVAEFVLAESGVVDPSEQLGDLALGERRFHGWKCGQIILLRGIVRGF